MMRSIAASMESSFLRSDEFGGFKLGDRLVGEPDLVEFAAPKQLHDDLEQLFIGSDGVADGAGPAEIIRGDGIGIADRPDIHDLQSALDQHQLCPPTD